MEKFSKFKKQIIADCTICLLYLLFLLLDYFYFNNTNKHIIVVLKMFEFSIGVIASISLINIISITINNTFFIKIKKDDLKSIVKNGKESNKTPTNNKVIKMDDLDKGDLNGK